MFQFGANLLSEQLRKHIHNSSQLQQLTQGQLLQQVNSLQQPISNELEVSCR